MQNDEEADIGIFLTRQFLNDREASLLLSSLETYSDSVVLMARRLTKKTELDDVIRLMLKNTLEATFKCEVHVWLSTLRHKWNGESHTEESILIAAISTRDGGRCIGRTLPGLDGGNQFCKLSLGSVELECFTDVKHLINRPWVDNFNMARTIELGHVDPSLNMGDILRELDGFTHLDVVGIARCDQRFIRERWARWLLLMSPEGSGFDLNKSPTPSKRLDCQCSQSCVPT